MNKKNIIIIIVSFIILGITCCLFLKNQNNSSVYLKITCDGKDVSAMYKKGDVFNCSLLGSDYKIKIDNISDKKIFLSSSDYGLFPIREDGTISLIEKVKKFELNKGKKLILGMQTTDITKDITIIWE